MNAFCVRCQRRSTGARMSQMTMKPPLGLVPPVIALADVRTSGIDARRSTAPIGPRASRCRLPVQSLPQGSSATHSLQELAKVMGADSRFRSAYWMSLTSFALMT